MPQKSKFDLSILALDLSLASTGLATYTTSMLQLVPQGQVSVSTLKPPKTAKDGMPRLHWIQDQIKRAVINLESTLRSPTLVVMEDLAFAAHDLRHERAGLACLIRYFLWSAKIPYVLVAPTSLKKFTTGSGKAEKSAMMLAVFKRWGYEVRNDNEADAVSLLRIGMVLRGVIQAETKQQQEVVALVSKNNSEALKLCGGK